MDAYSASQTQSNTVGTSNPQSSSTVVAIIETTRSKKTWEHYDLCQMSNGEQKARCKKCQMLLCPKANTTLSNHATKYCKEMKREKNKDQAPIAKDGTVFAYSEAAVREQFSQFVIQDALPFNHFDNPRLTRVIQNTLQPRYKTLTRSTLKRQCMSMWKMAKQQLVTLFENLNTSVSLTTDVWSAPHGLPTSYLCVTAHWIDPSSWQMMKRTVAFEQFESPHTGDNLFYLLKRVMAFYKIEQKVFSISFDNASNNTNAVEKLKLAYKPCVNGSFYHTRCVAHILNLCVQDGLGVPEIDVVKSNFKKMMQQVFCGPKVRYQNYMKLCKETDSLFLSPNWDVPTRWNSTHNMFKCALRQQSTLQHFHDGLVRKRKVEKEFSGSDWEIIKKLTELLEIFKDATNLVSGVYYPTSHLVLRQIWLICEKLGEYEYEDELFEPMLDSIKEKMKKYFEEMPPVFTCAAALNPCLNTSGVDLLLENICLNLELHQKDPFFAQKMKHEFLEQLKLLFRVYHDKFGSKGASSSSSSSFVTTKKVSDPYIHLYNMVRQENTKRARGEGSSANNNELGRYIGTNFLEHMRIEEYSNFDILAWWKEREGQFPVLSIMARDLLSVQASTVASESAFSLSGRVLSIRRTRLTPASLEMCICLKDYYDAIERVQHVSSLEYSALDLEEQIFNEEVEHGEAISLSDEELQHDEAMRGNSEEEY